MELIFKVTNPGTDADLVKHSNFKNHYPAVHGNTIWSDLEPYIKQAIRLHLLPWVGRELYDDIAAKFQADTALTDSQAETLELMQNAAAYYTIHLALPAMTSLVTSMGVQQSSDREGTSNPSSQWGFKSKWWSALLQGDNNIDLLLKFISKETDVYYDLWRNSDAYTFGTSDFIREVSDLSAIINFQDNMRTYKELVKYVKKAEQRYLLPVLGKEMYAELYTQLLYNTLTTENETLLPYVQKAAGEFGLYMAIPYLTLLVESDGIKVISQTDTMDNRRNLTNVTHQRAIESLRQEAENNGKTNLAELKSFLLLNAEDYPTFKNSSVYETYETDSTIYESSDGNGAIFL